MPVTLTEAEAIRRPQAGDGAAFELSSIIFIVAAFTPSAFAWYGNPADPEGFAAGCVPARFSQDRTFRGEIGLSSTWVARMNCQCGF